MTMTPLRNWAVLRSERSMSFNLKLTSVASGCCQHRLRAPFGRGFAAAIVEVGFTFVLVAFIIVVLPILRQDLEVRVAALILQLLFQKILRSQKFLRRIINSL